MTQSKSCEGCSQAHDCKSVYGQLGCSEGPPVTRAVLIAFLLPILVFVVMLAGFGWLVQNAVAGPYRTPLATVLALAVTTGVMLTVRVVARLHRKN